MGELGDWGYWLLFIIMAFVIYAWGYASGYGEGKKNARGIKKSPLRG